MKRMSYENNPGKKIQPGRSPEVRGSLFQNHPGSVSPSKVAFDQKSEQSKAAGIVGLDSGKKPTVHTEKEHFHVLICIAYYLVHSTLFPLSYILSVTIRDTTTVFTETPMLG